MVKPLPDPYQLVFYKPSSTLYLGALYDLATDIQLLVSAFTFACYIYSHLQQKCL